MKERQKYHSLAVMNQNSNCLFDKKSKVFKVQKQDRNKNINDGMQQ